MMWIGILNPLPAAILATAWRPLLDPLPLHTVWPLLLLPLIWALAVVYKAIKMPDLRHVWRQASLLAAQMLGLLVLAAIALWMISEWG